MSSELLKFPTPAEAPQQDRRAFDELRKQAVQASNRGHFQEAYELLGKALELARSLGDPDLVDRAFTGQVAAALELGHEHLPIGRLREILVRNSDEENCFLAAYTLSQVYDLGREYRKSLFYAQIARGYAARLQRQIWLASSHNQIANMLLATSYFDKACQEYQQALDLLSEDALFEKALIFDNLGYCRIVQKQHREGFRMLFWSLRTLRRLSARRYQALPHLGLCFAYMEVERYRDALKHGYRALQIAESEGDAESTKNALYLLGQAANLAGSPKIAHRFFSRLQSEFYPGDSFLAEMLLAVDVRHLVHLRA